jgi:exodeoxyribonuclease V gamma subunit
VPSPVATEPHAAEAPAAAESPRLGLSAAGSSRVEGSSAAESPRSEASCAAKSSRLGVSSVVKSAREDAGRREPSGPERMVRRAVLHLHRADRVDRLVGALAEVLVVPMADPFAAEVVAVPTRGVERWVAQRLSGKLGTGVGPATADGVCANVDFPSPRRLVDEAVAAGSAIDPERDPWAPARMVWPLLEVVDAQLGEPWLERLRHHLEPGRGDRSRRLRAVQHLARLYDQYALARPEMLNAWRLDRDDDAGGAPLPRHELWQAELWRRLREHVGRPGPAERLALACRELVVNPGASELPERIALFGLTALPARHLEVLRALAEGGRDVHLFLLQPSDAAWQHVQQALDRHGPPRERTHGATAFLPRNPLLASWGRDARELQMTLAHAQPWASDVHHDAGDAPPSTLLQEIQADVRGDRAPAATTTTTAADPSLQIHACHGAHRQVEVLRDAILHALQDDPTLEPRDVIVMCPDIETFAPLIQATFGTGEEPGEGHDLRVRLADRALRETNPVLGVVARLLDLTTARATASEVLDLADREPVRRRFRFGQDDTSRLEDWVAASGTRWGFDPETRTKDYNLPDFPQGTWQTGIDRLLAGVALTEDEPLLLAGTIVPLDDVDSSAIDLAGRFAEYLERLRTTIESFKDPKSIADWVAATTSAADALTATSPQDAWQRAELQRLLADVLDEATRDDNSTPTTTIDAADLSALLERRLAGRPTRASFRTGHLTVCTLQPMRSVPHRVVCLLGLDDTVFPRRAPRDGDDLLIAAPHVGDRDARSEDRQILLDALLAAEDRLIITYTGNDERTNAERAPAVPVAELLDVIERSAGQDVREHVVLRHPLQTFDARNFTADALGAPGPWSFDTTTLLGARALAAPDRPPPAGFLPDGALPDITNTLIELEDLVAFLGHPVHAFLRQRLGISFTTLPGEHLDDVEDELPIDLGYLTRWRIGDRLLTALLKGADFRLAQEAERRRGALAPGAIGAGHLQGLSDAASAIHDEYARLTSGGGAPGDLDVSIPIDGSARRLAGTISGLHGDVLPVVTFARVNARHRLGAWARVLALTAADPERAFSAVTVGRPRAGANERAQLTIARIPGVPGATPQARQQHAHAELAILVDLYDRGMREPLPIYCETSAAFAAAGDQRRRGLYAAEQRWTTPFGAPDREDRDADHERVLGRGTEFQHLLEDRPRADERWHPDEPTRFGQHAHRLWDRLLDHERLTDR